MLKWYAGMSTGGFDSARGRREWGRSGVLHQFGRQRGRDRCGGAAISRKRGDTIRRNSDG